MDLNIFNIVFGLLILCSATAAQNPYFVCSGDGHKEACTQMSRGSSEVNCIWVQDSIECAKRIANGTADFGMFSAESILQLAVLKWEDLSVVQPFAHRERKEAESDFQSVVIVRKDHKNGLEGLKGKKYCHPGITYNRNEKWSERFFKDFERKVALPKCEAQSPAELEAAALDNFFGDSCRPGIWSYDPNEDNALKKKYPSLCTLCPKRDCKYNDVSDESNHKSALKCLKDGGDVTYVSLQEAQLFFNTSADVNAADYMYLCKDGTTTEIAGNMRPCSWLRQPWKAVMTRVEKARDIQRKISEWMKKRYDGRWESDLIKVLNVEDFDPYGSPIIESPKDYMRDYRSVPADETYCNTKVSWCTTSNKEYNKCMVARAGGISTGIFPQINCRSPVHSTVQCLEDINRNDTDFMGIDSNYGWLARSNYNLTAALYFDTENDQYSTIVVVTKENSNIKNFVELRGKKACFPEYGSTPAVALVNELKDRKIFDKNNCNYGELLKDFFSDSCLPGAQDWKYVKTDNASLTSLCTLCFDSNNNNKNNGNSGDLGVSINTVNSSSIQPTWRSASMSSCAANKDNRYFGNRGGLKCLSEVGDVAVLELQSLKVHAEEVETDESQFRMLCRNNTLAKVTGFDVDIDCALTTVVDGEIVMYRKSPKTSSVIHVLQGLEHYFIIKNDPSFKIYNIFEGERNVLFKDSTIGLTHSDDDNQGVTVENYRKLFKDVEKCSGNSGISISINVISTIFIVFSAYILNH